MIRVSSLSCLLIPSNLLVEALGPQATYSLVGIALQWQLQCIYLNILAMHILTLRRHEQGVIALTTFMHNLQ